MKREQIEFGLVAILAAGVVATGVFVFEAKHESRQLFAELEQLKREQDRLQIDWGRLQIEQSTLATHPRIETLARERLELAEPTNAQMVVIAEPGS